MDSYEFWERAHRLKAVAHRAAASREEMLAEVVKTTKAMRTFAATMQASFDREVAEHPDLAELNVQMDSYYEGPTS